MEQAHIWCASPSRRDTELSSRRHSSTLAHRAADNVQFVAELVRRGITPAVDDVDAAAAAVSFLLSPEAYQQLVVQSGWTPEAYRAWVGEAVRSELERTARS